MAKRKTKKDLRVILIRSPIGYSKRQKRTVKALGLRRLNQSVEHFDRPEVRGMIESVQHMVRVEEIG